MKHILIKIVLFVLSAVMPLLSIAQKQSYTLKGFMGVQGGESFAYELKLTDSTGKYLQGTATTSHEDASGKFVAAAVVAVLDRSAKTLCITEKTITANKGFKSRAIICLVESILQYDEAAQKLSGQLATHTAGNGAACAKGSITFMNKEEINQLFNVAIAPVASVDKGEQPIHAKPKFDPSKPTKIVYDTLAKASTFVPKKLVEDITEGTDKTFIWKTDTVVLELWDGNTVDGDKVTIQYNGTDVLKDYMLTAAKKKIALPIGGNELNIITIIAGNEGSEPPNTANLLLHDGDIEYPVVAHNKFGKRAVIKIRKG